MRAGEARELSPMERAVLCSLQSAGRVPLIDLACRVTPALRPNPALRPEEADQAVAHALRCLKVVRHLAYEGYVACQGTSSIGITASGRALVLATSAGRAVPQGVMSAGATASLSLALSACSLASLQHQSAVQPVPVQPAYSVQQVRSPDGSLRFAACASDCAPLTPKTLANDLQSSPLTLPKVTAVNPTVVDQGATRVAMKAPPIAHAEPAPVSLHRVYFRFGSAQLEPEARQAIQRAIPELKQRSRIEIFAGADPVGTVEQNEKIKELRRRSVERLLVGMGVDPLAIDRKTNGAATAAGIQAQGMRPRTTVFAEMRKVEIFSY